MSNLSSPSQSNKQKYIMRVCNRLLIKLRLNGVEPSEAVCFFGSQVEGMLGCKPNFGPRSNKSTLMGLRKDVWLMRGFYPNTPQMFKISIAQNDAFADSHEYYVKISEPTVRVPSNKSERQLNFTPRYESSFDSREIREELDKRLEKEMLGLPHEIESLVSNKVVFTPKCISPKGMPLYRFIPKKKE